MLPAYFDVCSDTRQEITPTIHSLPESGVKENFEPRFLWQEGYAAFTVSPSATDSVRSYIANQEEHHRKYSFVDELKELLARAGIEYEEKYLL